MCPLTSPDEDAWIEDDPDDYMETDMEDEDFADDFDDLDEETELDLEAESHPKKFSARQRIEMVREQQWLKSMMEDFGDFDEYDKFEDTADDYLGGFSH
jgi:hypothetical protein